MEARQSPERHPGDTASPIVGFYLASPTAYQEIKQGNIMDQLLYDEKLDFGILKTYAKMYVVMGDTYFENQIIFCGIYNLEFWKKNS